MFFLEECLALTEFTFGLFIKILIISVQDSPPLKALYDSGCLLGDSDLFDAQLDEDSEQHLEEEDEESLNAIRSAVKKKAKRKVSCHCLTYVKSIYERFSKHSLKTVTVVFPHEPGSTWHNHKLFSARPMNVRRGVIVLVTKAAREAFVFYILKISVISPAHGMIKQ